MSVIIRMSGEAHQELKEAIMAGALSDRYNLFASMLDKGNERIESRMANLDDAAKQVFNATEEQMFIDRNYLFWSNMTDAEWQSAAIAMEKYANEELEKGPGGFMTNYLETLKHLAKAYYHADSSNQQKLRSQFGFIFWCYHGRRPSDKA